jgi:SAM-dependent methyltransferase
LYIKPENTVAVKNRRTIGEARDYEKKYQFRPKWQRRDRFEKAFARYAFEMAGKDSHVVDIPCGSGRFFEIFSKARKLTMADYSQNMLGVCEEKFGTPDNVEFVEGEISSLLLSDNSADLCFCMRLFHHMKTDEVRLGVLRELARVSKKYVAFSFYNQNCLRFYWRRIRGKNLRGNYVPFGHLINLARHTGLELVRRFPRVNFIEEQCLVIFKKA